MNTTKEIYQHSISIDALCAPLIDVDLPIKQAILDEISQSGITAIHYTVSEEDFESTVDTIAWTYGLIQQYPELFMLIRQHADFEQAKGESKVGIVMGFQFPQPISCDLHRLQLFHWLGVRIMQLTYNNRSLFGDGCLEFVNAGLSNLGRQCIEQMNSLGIAIDLSHCGTETTADSIAASTKPVLITHSGCCAVYQHPRNKEDRELRAMAERGGVIGIYMMPFLGGNSGLATTELFMQHLAHALNVCGSDHVGVGSDQRLQAVQDTPHYRKELATNFAARKKAGVVTLGEERPLYIQGFNSSRRLETLAILMKQRGYSSQVIEKVIGGNFYRVLKDIWI